MDMLDRLGRLLKSLIPEEDDHFGRADPDLTAAWEELNGYLDDESAGGEPLRDAEPRSPLREAYAILEVAPGASMEAVRESYKRLLRKYHPDRFAGKPDKQRAATEVTRAVIGAYRTIRHQKE